MGLRNMRGKWQYRFVVHGQAVCVTLDLAATERNRTKALTKEAVHRQAIEEGRWGFRPLVPRSFIDAQSDFEEWLRVEYQGKPNTWRRIITSMASCRHFFKDMMISMIHPGDVERYKIWRLRPGDDGVREVTAKHDLDNLSIFFQWGMKAGYARQNPVKEVKRPSDAKAIRERILTHAEEKLYFAKAKENLWKVARLILLQGMRPEEVMRIRKENVDLERGTLRVMFGKTPAARRTLKLTQESLSILAAQMAQTGIKGKSKSVVNQQLTTDRDATAAFTRSCEASLPSMLASKGVVPERQVSLDDSSWIFPSPKRPGAHITKLNCPHNRLCEKLNLHFVLYDLRHTFATRMVAAGVDLVVLGKILGHEKISVTMRYVHLQQASSDAAMVVYNRLNEESRKELVQ